MSEPKRYSNLDIWKALHFGEGDEGWVKWEDYARLKAEVERLNAECNGLIKGAENDIAYYKAQVERLTKAGDAMWNALLCSGCSECMGMYDCHDEAMKLWKAAKEGKTDA